MENLLQLDSRVMCSIIAKELEDFSVDHAPIQVGFNSYIYNSLIQRVMKAIIAREECLRQIEGFSQDQLKNYGNQL